MKYSEVNDPADPKGHKRQSATTLEFWRRTDLIEKHPLAEGIKKDLEKHGPLEEQFGKNGQN